MSSRNNVAMAVAIALLGAGAWWFLSSSRPQEGEESQLSIPHQPQPSIEEVVPDLAPPVDVLDEGGEILSEEQSPMPKSPPPSVVWSKDALAFLDRPNPDPVVSSEIEYAIQRSISSRLDTTRYDAHAIDCRGRECQILLVDRAPMPSGSGASAIATIMRDLSEGSIQIPSTGDPLGAPTLQSFMNEPDGLIVTRMAFELAKP